MQKKSCKPSLWTLAALGWMLAILSAVPGCALNAKPITQPKEVTMEFQTLEVSDMAIRFAQGGPQGAPTVVLLSPLPQSIVAYHNVWDRLTRHFRVYAIDLPGFGRSEGGAEVMNMFTQGKLLEDIFRKLNIESPHIVGPDVGTPVIFAYLQRSDNAASALVGDGPAVYPPQMGKAVDRMMHSNFWRSVYSLNAGLFVKSGSRACYVKYKPGRWETEDYIASYKGRMNAVMTWFASYESLLPRIDAGLKDVDIPVKVFWGDKDVIVLPENAQLIHDKLPRSQMHIFQGAGHYSYQDAADEFASMVIQWVNVDHKSI